MVALASTTLSLSAPWVTVTLSRGTTATCENRAPAGFQHFVHPHTWLWAVCAATRTWTGLLAHLQVSVPPAKLALPAFTPPSTAGWIETAMAYPPWLVEGALLAPGRIDRIQ